MGSSVDKRVGAEVGKLVLVCGAEEGRLFSLVVFTPAENPLPHISIPAGHSPVLSVPPGSFALTSR